MTPQDMTPHDALAAAMKWRSRNSNDGGIHMSAPTPDEALATLREQGYILIHTTALEELAAADAITPEVDVPNDFAAAMARAAEDVRRMGYFLSASGLDMEQVTRALATIYWHTDGEEANR